MDKQTLRDYREMQIEIDTLEKRILLMQNRISSPKYQKFLSEKNYAQDFNKLDGTIKNLILDMEEKCSSINNLLENSKTKIQEIEQVIEKLDPLERTVITLYYIDCISQDRKVRTWNDVAKLIVYSLRRTQDIHKNAIEKLSVM